MEEFNIVTIRNDFRTWFQNNKQYQIDTEWHTKTIPKKPYHDIVWREQHTFSSTLFYFTIEFAYVPKDKVYFLGIKGYSSPIPLDISEWLETIKFTTKSTQRFFPKKYNRMVQEKQLGGSFYDEVVYTNKLNSIDELAHCISVWKECIQNDYQSIFEEERHMIEGLQRQCSVSFEKLFTDFNETISKEEFMEWSTEFTKELGTPK